MKEKMSSVLCGLLCLGLLSGCNFGQAFSGKETVTLNNPILPGYYADPSIVEYEGKFYLYATADPWGTDFLSCWVSDDFQEWTFHQLNWPTKEACTSSLSNESKVWAPSVVRKGKWFYMYISIGGEVWCGRAPHPLGPWENMLEGRPLIPFDTTMYAHTIDAEAFIDTDGKAYLYWGSGWDWKNGHCFVAELDEEMNAFATTPQEVTPTGYFEGPLMFKEADRYYLTYSDGKTLDDTYKVRYAMGNSPSGPFTEARNSPLLQTDVLKQVYGPGHHTIFTYDNKCYILYHRHRLPYVKNSAFRQLCINELHIDRETKELACVEPSSEQPFSASRRDKRARIQPQQATATSISAQFHAAGYSCDGSYATRWESAEQTAVLQFDFAASVRVDTMSIRMEYAWKRYTFIVETSQDGAAWSEAADFSAQGVSGSPIHVPIGRPCKAVRLRFTQGSATEATPSVWDVLFYQ